MLRAGKSGNKRVLLVSAIASAAVGAPALAEKAWPAPAAGLEEIVVTGTKAPAPLERTSASVSAITAQDLENLPPIDGIPDATRVIPNAIPPAAGFGYALRGLESGSRGYSVLTTGIRSRTPMIVDGVAQSFQTGFRDAVSGYEVEQIEVFRGVQSQAIGRGAIAGAFVVRTRDPGPKPEAYAVTGVGEHALREAALGLSLPLIADALALRISGDWAERDSYVDYTDPALTAFAESPATEERWTGAAKLVFTPQAHPGLTVRAGFRQSYQQSGERDPVDIGGGRTYSGSNGAATFRVEPSQAFLEAEQRLGQGLTLVAIGSWYDSLESFLQPAPGINGDIAVTQWSGEVRLVADQALSGRLSGVVGVAGFTRDQAEDFSGFGAGLTSRFDDEVTSLAAFADGEWRVSPRLFVLGGLRVETEEQDRTGQLVTFAPATDVGVSIPSDALLPKIGLAFEPRAGLRLGVTATKGQTSGGAGASLVGTDFRYDEERVWQYEVFGRWAGPGRAWSLRANAFYNAFEDLQLDTLASEDSLDSIVANAPEAHSYGAEVEARWTPAPTLELIAGAGLLHTEFDAGVLDGVDLAGNAFPLAPEANAVLGAAWRANERLSLSGDARYVSRYFSDADNASEERAGDYATVNVQARLALNRALDLRLYAKNVFDEDAVTFVSAPTFAVLTPPRTMGLRVSARLP